MTCIKHTYRQVNNRYDKKGKHVIEGGEWRTETRCKDCNKLFKEPKWKKELIKK